MKNHKTHLNISKNELARRHPLRFRLITCLGLFALLLIALTACGPQESCSEQAKEYVSQFERIGLEWDEATVDAGLLDGSPENSSLIVPELERLKTMLDEIDRPECADAVHEQGINYLAMVATANIMRAQGRPNQEIEQAFKIAEEAQLEWVFEFNKLKNGEPPFDE
jgi:hypothetical protein